MRIEVTRASRGLSAIAELLVLFVTMKIHRWVFGLPTVDPGISLMRSMCRKYMTLPPESSVSVEFTRFWSTRYTKLEQPTPVACHVNAILAYFSLSCIVYVNPENNYRYVLPNIDRMQATKRPKNGVFVPGDLYLWPSTLTFKLVRARDHRSTHVFRVNLAQIRLVIPESRDISHTSKKNPTDWRRQKQNLPQFTACGKKIRFWTMAPGFAFYIWGNSYLRDTWCTLVMT